MIMLTTVSFDPSSRGLHPDFQKLPWFWWKGGGTAVILQTVAGVLQLAFLKMWLLLPGKAKELCGFKLS